MSAESIIDRMKFHLRQLDAHQRQREAARIMQEAVTELVRLNERLSVLKTELLCVRNKPVEDQFDMNCQLRQFRDLVDRWCPKVLSETASH
jgi:hypothetical protein